MSTPNCQSGSHRPSPRSRSLDSSRSAPGRRSAGGPSSSTRGTTISTSSWSSRARSRSAMCRRRHEAHRDARPGGFLGDPSTLSGRAAVVQARAEEDSEVLRIPPDRFRRIVVEDSELSDLFLRTFLDRRSALIAGGYGSARVIGSRYSRDTHRIREFLTRNSQPYTFLDLENDEAVAALLESLHVGVEETPIFVCRPGHVARNPSDDDARPRPRLRQRQPGPRCATSWSSARGPRASPRRSTPPPRG